MNIIFEYDGVKASEKLEASISKKLNTLSNKYDFIIRAVVFLKTERTHSSETGKICNIKLSVPGPLLFAESSAQDFEKAMHTVIKELDTQLAKKKGKMKGH